mgnify:CR=1 FL=1
MDRITKAQRSYNMSRVRSTNTLPERIIFSELKKLNIKFKKHARIPGKPDAVISQGEVAVFVNGEFWHGRRFDNWKSDLSAFWKKKISGNMERDKKNYVTLRSMGWKVIRVWDKDIIKNKSGALRKILQAMQSPG